MFQFCQRTPWVCSFALTTFAAPLWAQNSDTALPQPALEEVVVIANRIPTTLQTVGTAVSLIDQQTLRDQGFDSVADQLATQVGLSVSHSGGLGSATSVRIRGEEAYRTQLRIDGLKIVDPSAPQAMPIFDGVLLNNAQGVEILRGPQGMVYGADAGGVVSVESRSYSRGTAASLDVKAGDDGLQRWQGGVGTGGNLGQIGLAFTQIETDGFNSQESDNSDERDGYNNQTLHLKGELNVAERWQLGLVAREQQGEVEYDSCYDFNFAVSNDCRSEADISAQLVSLTYNGERLPQQLLISRTESTRDDYTAGSFSFGTEGKIERAEYLGQWLLASNNSLIYGVDFERESIPGVERDQTGYHLAYAGALAERFYYHAGVRYDDNEEFGSFSNGRLSASWLLLSSASGTLQLRASYGTGFRAPSLSEQFYNSNYAEGEALGLVLQEENSSGYDTALAWYGSNGLKASVGLFQQSIEDEIQFVYFADLGDPAQGLTSGYIQGSGKAKSRGAELELSYPLLPSLSLQANYTYNDTETSAGEQRARRPEQLANIGLAASPIERVRLFANWRIVRDSVEFNGEPLPDYEVVDLSLSYSASQAIQIYLNVENALDEDYQEIAGYNTGGRKAYLGARWSFN
ncbi:TonB-dependent receptor plug domain-containing protein [Halioxenophilus sp. WMMB6]|uniref:TonB-dependent receptor plug domain-containing protein n=1 Tax=Halioxenophilus sp. WMMB6 TaxID=3073815 RepID=UPI00295E9727|nr:TonB-dependent receptor [Halioxenophilus sp. WMMB6]